MFSSGKVPERLMGVMIFEAFTPKILRLVMVTLIKKIDEIIEDPRKSKAVLNWLKQHGMLDETMISMWIIEQNNKECVCKHCYPGGQSALTDAVGITSCRICGGSDYPDNSL